MFAFGFFVTIIQIIRIFSIANLKAYTNSNSIVSWSIVEINIGTMVACVPTYGILVRNLLHKLPRQYQPSFVRSHYNNPSAGFYELKESRKSRRVDPNALDQEVLVPPTGGHHGASPLSSPKHAVSVTGGQVADSSEHILPFQSRSANDEILVKTDIKITNEQRANSPRQ